MDLLVVVTQRSRAGPISFAPPALSNAPPRGEKTHVKPTRGASVPKNQKTFTRETDV
jgi:hypothetical protein